MKNLNDYLDPPTPERLREEGAMGLRAMFQRMKVKQEAANGIR